MLSLYEHITQEREVLSEIGITNLTATQLDCLIQLPLTCSVSCMLLFSSWVDEGLYDFCNLPFPLKTHMSDVDRVAVEQELKESWTGSLGDLLTEMKQLIDVLKHSEGDIIKKVNESSQVNPHFTHTRTHTHTHTLPPLFPLIVSLLPPYSALVVLMIFFVNLQKPIIDYLIDYHMLDREDQLAKSIPKTILLQHYVSFRQTLRR